eukprot:RCo052261
MGHGYAAEVLRSLFFFLLPSAFFFFIAIDADFVLLLWASFFVRKGREGEVENNSYHTEPHSPSPTISICILHPTPPRPHLFPSPFACPSRASPPPPPPPPPS